MVPEFMEDPVSLERAEYNKRLGELLDVVLRIGGADNYRFRECGPHPQDKEQWRERIFDVYWNGSWWHVGSEYVGPDDMGSPHVGTTQRKYEWDEMRAIGMMHRYTAGITSDRAVKS